MTTINLNPTTALGFFIATGVLAYYAPHSPPLEEFAWASLYCFVALGPLRWAANTLGRVRLMLDHRDQAWIRVEEFPWVAPSIDILVLILTAVLLWQVVSRTADGVLLIG